MTVCPYLPAKSIFKKNLLVSATGLVMTPQMAVPLHVVLKHLANQSVNWALVCDLLATRIDLD